MLAPLNVLLQEGSKWTWTETQQTAFDEAKKLLQSSVVLAHCDSSKQLVLACDTSPYGIRVVLFQYQEDGILLLHQDPCQRQRKIILTLKQKDWQ